MDLFNYKDIKAKLKKRTIFTRRPSLEDEDSPFFAVAKQIDDANLYKELYHFVMKSANNQSGSNVKSNQVGAYLKTARNLAAASHEKNPPDNYIKAVIWIYTESLHICDQSLIKPIRIEFGRFYESHKMFEQAAECYKQSMSISRCVYNLILCNNFKGALEELRNCPSHLLTNHDYTNMFLLELLTVDDLAELKVNARKYFYLNSQIETQRGALPIDEQLYNLSSLLESFVIIQYEIQNKVLAPEQSEKIQQSIMYKLRPYLDPAQIQLVHLIAARDAKDALLADDAQ